MEILRNVHSIWVYLVMIMGVIAIGQMLRGRFRQEDWRPIDENIGYLFITALDFELVLGILLWIFQGRWDGQDVLHSVRHPLLMLAAWIAIRYGWFRAKQIVDPTGKFGRAALFFSIGGVILLVGIFQIYGIF